jgi:hypothetical protein
MRDHWSMQVKATPKQVCALVGDLLEAKAEAGSGATGGSAS